MYTFNREDTAVYVKIEKKEMFKRPSVNMFKWGLLNKMILDAGSLNLKNCLASCLMYAG